MHPRPLLSPQEIQAFNNCILAKNNTRTTLMTFQDFGYITGFDEPEIHFEDQVVSVKIYISIDRLKDRTGKDIRKRVDDYCNDESKRYGLDTYIMVQSSYASPNVER